jgi:hypothetical protein
VEIDDGVYAGVFVVCQVKKTLLHKTMFHLCATDDDRFWVRLKRNKKGGVTFRPLRRVVKVSFVEPVKPVKPVKTDDLSQKPVAQSAPSTPTSPAAQPSAAAAEEEGLAAQYEMYLNDFGAEEE